MSDLNNAPSVLSVVRNIQDLPISAIVTAQDQDADSLAVPASVLSFSAVPGPNDGWFVDVGVKNGESTDLVMSLRVAGGVAEAARTIDMLQENFAA